ncbi:hypothetical protein RLW55_16870 [Hyphomicrobium sp. B1]|uniref:hypothetical protein n=1 Tax=Hyphomicrobium sp. B1 TaxID=3075651 RepID=UPI003C2FDACA
MAAHGCPASTGTVGVKLAAGDSKRLRFIADVSRAAPINSEKAAEQFLDLMQDAVSRGYLPEVVAFAELRRLRDAIVAKFEWPDVSDKRLLKLIERNGYAKTVHRDRSAGKDRRTVAYRLV